VEPPRCEKAYGDQQRGWVSKESCYEREESRCKASRGIAQVKTKRDRQIDRPLSTAVEKTGLDKKKTTERKGEK